MLKLYSSLMMDYAYKRFKTLFVSSILKQNKMVTRPTTKMDCINFVGEHNLCEEQEGAELHFGQNPNLYVI